MLLVVAVGIALSLGVLGPNWRLAGAATIFLGIASGLAALFVLPNSVRAWRTGAEGEVATARVLEPLTQLGFVVLHDRRVPGRRENIDHVVIGPTGVYVVETKNYAGELRVRDEVLYVNGRRRSGVVDQVDRQAAAVSAVLENVPVLRIVVVHRAEFPLLSRPNIDGVPIVSGRSLAETIRDASIVLDRAEVDRLARLANSRLQSAS